jgi:glutamine synthetase
VDVPERQARGAQAEQLVRTLVERDVAMVATTFLDSAGISRVKSVPLRRLPQLAASGVGASTSFDYFRFDVWLAAPPAALHQLVIFASLPICGDWSRWPLTRLGLGAR